MSETAKPPREPCAHTPLVQMHADMPGDPPYPLVVCPKCMTKWVGHVDDVASRHPPKSVFSAALRDAIILGQDESALTLLDQELGLSRRPRPPNAILSASASQRIEPGQVFEVITRPQIGPLRPTHFVVDASCADDFDIADITVGNRSQFPQSGSVPARAFACTLRGILEAGTVPNANAREINLQGTIALADDGELPPACSAFAWETAQTAMDIIVFARMHDTAKPRRFMSYFLGLQIDLRGRHADLLLSRNAWRRDTLDP